LNTIEINNREIEGAITNGQSSETRNIGTGQRQTKQKTQHRKLKRWATRTPPKHLRRKPETAILIMCICFFLF